MDSPGGSGHLPRFGPRETGVRCPTCGEGTLELHRTCLRTRFSCPRCRAAYSLDQLAPSLDDETFTRLAEAVGDHLSDRV
jgi:uncharacterized protein (DUF983 family)